jgi:lipoprotein signal peptidase
LLLLAVGLFGCDHATKLAAKSMLDGSAAVPIAPSILRGAVDLRYTENRDIAFSAFSALGLSPSPTVLAVLSAIVLAALVAMVVVVRRRAGRSEQTDALMRDRVAQAGFALALGGGVGNVVDRAMRGVVIDFIHVRGWPTFNVADVAIVVGIALIALRWRTLSPTPTPSG